MEFEYFILSSLLFISAKGEQEYNVTFHEGKTTWIDATKHCYDNDEVLYNNKDDIKNLLTNISVEVWAGEYTALSPWTVTWGCHTIQDISTKTKFKVPRINQTECQFLCNGTEYFAIKDDTCVCLLLGDLKDKLPYNPCSCDRCYRVIRHNITNMKNVAMSCKDETKCLCIYAVCTDKGISLTPGNCGLEFIVKCDGVTNTKRVYKNHTDAVRFCNEKSAILQWYTHDSCLLSMGTAQHWTGGTRMYNTYQVKRQELPNLLPSFRCLKLTKQADSEVYGACDKQNDVLPFFCKLDNKQTNKVISENNNTVNLRQYDLEFVKHSVVENIGIDPLKLPGMIIGIVISISVLVLTILVILAFMYRRTYAKENASSNTAGREDLNKNDMDNNTVISDYQQLDDVDDVQKNTNAYDQLSVTRNVHTESINDQANTSFSREEYSKYESIVDSNGINTNTAISDYEELHKSDKDTSTQAYDQLNVTRKVKTEPTNFFSKITASTEKHSKTESTKATAATSEYEQLDNAKKDKGVNVYDQLHVTDMIDNEQTNYKSKTTKPRDQQSNDKPTEETTKLSKRTVSSEYEHLDNATKDTSVNVCDNLNDSGVMDNDPTHHNPCQ